MRQCRDIQDVRLGEIGLLSAILASSDSQANKADPDSAVSVMSVTGDEPHCRVA